MSKPKTQKQLDAAADARLRRTYNITLAEYDLLSRKHDGGCWICRFVPQGRRLHVDHDHGWKKCDISCRKIEGSWFAEAVYNGVHHNTFGTKKSLAVRALKKLLLRASVRGLGCWKCNRGLAIYRDRPDYLRSAAQYLDDFTAGRTREVLGT